MLNKKLIFRLSAIMAITIIVLAIPKSSLSDTPPTTTLSIDASATTGSNGWYTSAVPVTMTAVPGTYPVTTIHHWLDSDPPTISSNNPATRTLVVQGTHTLNYFATDSNNQIEATRSFGYKIDLVAPAPWTNFTLTQSGNNHTFIITVNIADKTSGLNPATAEFQYSVDDGTTWGYYENLDKCNGTFYTDQWKAASVAPNTPGTSTGVITIPKTDYCNSDWATTKYIRIRVKDMAGLLSTRQYALMSPWLKTTGGDVYSASNIDMLIEQGTTVGGAVITATDTQNNMTSAQGWSVTNYPMTVQGYYSPFITKFGDNTTALPATFPTTSGVYTTNSLSLSSVPNSLSTAKNKAIIVFVNGDLFLDTNVQLDPSSTIMWIVSGDAGIKRTRTRADGLYFVDGEFNSAYDGNSNDQLTINGLIAANNGIILSRSLNGNDNLTKPSEMIYFTPSVFINPQLMKLMKLSTGITWKEYITY